MALARHALGPFRDQLSGAVAVLVGLLGAALYDPVWTSAVQGPADFSLALIAFGLLMFWRFAPWSVVVISALGGTLIGLFA